MKLSIAVGAAVLSAATAASAGVTPYSDLIVFGDSLVDSGNIFTVTGGLVPDPTAGYFNGRFQEGPNFADLLNNEIEGSLLAPSLLGGDNYAYGGARIVSNLGDGPGQDLIPDLDLQVGTYFFGTGGTADADALYAINMAGNDIFAIGRGQTGGLSADEYIALAAQRTVANVVALDQAGATNILLMGVPNTTEAAGIALENAILTSLAATDIEAEIFNFSYFDFFGTLLTDPNALGLPQQDLSVTCLEAREVVDGAIDCTGIFSFDGVHFTAPIQAALFREVSELVGINQVPAPGALALFGIAALGLGVRRRLSVGARA
ncbi:MAG: SGNH/GDSL hydrolase family protein [Pacificimonas sp.]